MGWYGEEGQPRGMNAERQCVLNGECRPRHGGGKSTAKWCRGRVGIPHTWEWIRNDRLPNASGYVGRTRNKPNRVWETQVCFDCGKHGDGRSYCGPCGEPSAFTVTIQRPYTWSFRKHQSSHMVTRTCYSIDRYCRHCYAPEYGTQPAHAKAKRAA